MKFYTRTATQKLTPRFSRFKHICIKQVIVENIFKKKKIQTSIFLKHYMPQKQNPQNQFLLKKFQTDYLELYKFIWS